MTLFISAEEVTKVLDMQSCIDAMEQAFIEEGRGDAVNHPRQRYTIPKETRENETAWWTNIIGGGTPSTGLAALRIDSGRVRESTKAGNRRMDWEYPDRRSWGFVILFSLETGKPVAVYQDFTISPIRVAATTAVAVRSLTSPNARQMGLFGSGNEAIKHLEALCLVRDLDQVRVYSPNPQHRTDFAAMMDPTVPAEVVAVDDPKKVVDGSDIVMCATNSSTPVFDGAWLTDGQFVGTIVNTDHNTQRTEVDRTTFVRSSTIVLHSIQTARDNDQVELWEPVEAGDVSMDQVFELGDLLVAGDAKTTKLGTDKIIYYKANCGVGIQFAAAGAVIHERCVSQGLGTEIPTELFGADVSWWLDRGFNPSP